MMNGRHPNFEGRRTLRAITRVASACAALALCLILAAAWPPPAGAAAAESSLPSRGSYAVVVSQKTYNLPDWKEVVDALRAKHDGALIIYPAAVTDARDELKRIMPRYTCFVAQPEEAEREFVVAIHRMTRQLDPDPYTDTLWGIVTGYTAQDALRIVGRKEPLIVRRGLSGTISFDTGAYDEAIRYSESEAGARYVKPLGRPEAKEKIDPDSTKMIADGLNTFKPDIFYTSGHASEKNWKIGYTFEAGYLRCKDGQLFATDKKNQRVDINSPNSKAFMPVGNCLIGHIPGRDCMALALMHSGGVDQMIGYTVVTFFGYMGWGVDKYFTGERSRYSLAQAFYLNNQALVNLLETKYPAHARDNIDSLNEQDAMRVGRQRGYAQELLGLLWDRDTVTLYGDPAWEVRYPAQEAAWSSALTGEGGRYTFKVTVNRDGNWGDRPLIAFFPTPLTGFKITGGAELKPVLARNFILLPLTGARKKGDQAQVVFEAQTAPAQPTTARMRPRVAQHQEPAKPLPDAVKKEIGALAPAPYGPALAEALAQAGDNREAWLGALRQSQGERREAAAFLLANMPAPDLRTLTAAYFNENIELALQSRKETSWGHAIPQEIFSE